MPTRASKCNLKLILLVCFFCCSSLIAQTTKKTTLLALIPTLETTYNIRFSFDSNALSEIEITTPPTQKTLAETLSHLNNTTPFTFTQIDERYITIVSKASLFFCGKITDAYNNATLEGATIEATLQRFSTVTNAEGIFFISKNEPQQITIRHLGYQTRTVPVSQLSTNCATITLTPVVSSLEQVLLHTYFTKGIRKQQNGAFKINTDNFGLLPGQVDGDVLQIAQALPGVESVDETISNINIRGGTHAETNILWDDIKMYQSGHFFGLISAFNPDITKKVTVFKNGTHPRYGEGVSGVIDMRSENENTTAFSGGAGFNLINAHAFAEIPITSNFGIQVSGRRSINDFIESPVFGIYEDRIFQDSEITAIATDDNGTEVASEYDFTFYDFSTKLLWDISEKSNIRINFLTIDNELEFTETLNASASSETSNLQQRSLVGGLSWEYQWNSKVKTQLLGYASYYKLNAINEEIFTTQKLLQENEILETGVKVDATWNLSEKIEIQGGYHFSEVGIANTQDINLPRFRSYDKNVLQTHSAFGNLHFTPNNEKTSIHTGIRVNHFTELKTTLVEPRLSIHQSLGNGFAVEALGEFKSQSTTHRIDFESDFLGVEKRRWVLADNEGVPIIKSKQVSFGLVYNKSNWFVNLEGFYKFVEGITTANQGFQNQFQFTRSTGEYAAKGLEFVLNKKTKSYSTWLSYMLLKNDYSFDALSPSEFPNNLDIRHTATLANTLAFNKFKLALGINWHSGKPYTVPMTNEEIAITDGIPSIQYDFPNQERLSSYFRVNLSAEHIWNLSEKLDAKINFALLNVFNTKNTLNIRYAIDTDKNGTLRVNQIEEISLGLTPNFSAQLLF